jgi:hypothetical protein
VSKSTKEKSNEYIKLRANYYNGIAVACFAVGGLGAGLRILNEAEEISRSFPVAIVWLGLGTILSTLVHFMAIDMIATLKD